MDITAQEILNSLFNPEDKVASEFLMTRSVECLPVRSLMWNAVSLLPSKKL